MSAINGAAWNDAALAVHQVSAMLNTVAENVSLLEQRLGISSSEAPAESPALFEEQPKRLPWVWVTGETMPYRHLFREAGGRWSPRKQAWYFINCAELPEHLRNLPGIVIEVTY